MNGPTKNESDKLGKRSERLEWCNVIAGGLVVVGLFIEYWRDIYAAVTWQRRMPLGAVGGILVIFGVAAEVVLSMIVSGIANQIKRISDIAVAEANERVAEADKAIAELRLALEKARKETSEVQLKLSRQLHGLAEAQLPRRLNGKYFVECLLRVEQPQAIIQVWYKPNDDEARNFARDIWVWLGYGPRNDGARWQTAEPVEIPHVPDPRHPHITPTVQYGAKGGLSIIVGSKFESAIDDPRSWVNQLHTAFIFAGRVSACVFRVDPTRTPNTVIVVVGQKP